MPRIVLHRQIKRPVYQKRDRLLLVLLASVARTWKTLLRNHAAEVWACDCLQVTTLFFRPLFAFFVIESQSRKVLYVHVT